MQNEWPSSSNKLQLWLVVFKTDATLDFHRSYVPENMLSYKIINQKFPSLNISVFLSHLLTKKIIKNRLGVDQVLGMEINERIKIKYG